MEFTFFLQLLINGLVVGVVYALIATGLSLIFGVLEIVNFAHGEFYMLGAMLAYFLSTQLHLPYWWMVASVVVVSFAVGYLLYVTLLSAMRGANFERSMLLTLGLSMVLQNGAIYLFSTTPRMMRTGYSFQSAMVGDVRVSLLRLFALGLGVAAFVLLYGVLHHTRIGKAMRAVAINRDAALMVGIDPKLVSSTAVAVGIGLSGLAGAALAPVYSVHPLMGASFIFKAFALVIIGGLGNVTGTATAAVALGVMESFAGGYLPLVLVDAMAFIVMIAVLLVKPQGLFGPGGAHLTLPKPILALSVLAGIVVLAAVPAFGPGEYVLALGISFATFAVLSSGLNLVYGYTGMMSYGQVGFFGIGGYTTALLVQDYGLGLVPALLLGGVLGALVSLLLGYTALRLSRHAFSIVSLSFSLLCVILARDWVDVTRGPMGIPGLAAPAIGLGPWHIGLSRPVDFYYAAMLVAFIAHAVVWFIANSRIGRAMRAVKLNEPLAQSQGISPVGLKLLAIGVSAFLAAVMGGVFVFYLSIVDPSIFDFYYTEAMLIMVIVGGAGSFWCVLLATAVFTIVPDMLRFTTDLRMVLYGLILIAAMLVMPGGLGGWLRARQIAKWRHPGRQRALQAQLAASTNRGPA